MATTLTALEVRHAVAQMATDLLEIAGDSDSLVIMGIYRRGDDLAELMRGELRRVRPNLTIDLGSIDITLYRDDLMSVGPKPVVGGSELPAGGIDRRTVVLVDDVLFTGRTVRAALTELADWGRPRHTYLCVLIDRGGRELPIQPDVVGARLEVPPQGRVDVLVPELDGKLGVEVTQ